jgi:hypothetical protein
MPGKLGARSVHKFIGAGAATGRGAPLKEGFLSNVLRHAPWMVVIWAALPVTPVAAQGNIDAGKTPAQIFGDTCSACHRSARELKRASTSFLRTHYSTGADEAAAMAGYLAGVASDPRAAAQPKRPPNEVGKQAPGPSRPATEQPKSAQSAPGQPKGRPPNLAAQTRPAPVVEERPDPPPAPPAPPAPVLEPFEE